MTERDTRQTRRCKEINTENRGNWEFGRLAAITLVLGVGTTAALIVQKEREAGGDFAPAKVGRQISPDQINQAQEVYGQLLFQNETRKSSKEQVDAVYDDNREWRVFRRAITVPNLPAMTSTPVEQTKESIPDVPAVTSVPSYPGTRSSQDAQVRVTHYGYINDSTGGGDLTASGKEVAPGIAACGPSHLGDMVVVAGMTFECADRGGLVGDLNIDIWCYDPLGDHWGFPGTPEYDMACPVESGTQTATFIVN